MQHRRDVNLSTPALILVAGNADRKPHSLDRDVTTIGRARGSDLCLAASEISTLHCVIYRTSEGYRIRDCNSRSGTRVNGQAVKNGRLHDGDLVHIGHVSFEFRLPAPLFPNDGGKVDPAQVEHWKRSRRKLALLALKLRKRVTHGSASVSEQDWAHKAHLLKEKIRCYDQRLHELEDAEKELTDERAQLEREAESQRQHGQQVEGQLADRLAKADEEIHARWQEFQQRCQTEEMHANRRAAALQEPGAGEDHDTEQMRQHLRDSEDQITRQQEQLLREQEEFTTMKEQWVKAQAKSSEALEDQQAVLAQQESAVRTQKAELTRMMGELKKMQEDLRKQAKADVRALQEDLERTKSENAELRATLDELAQSEPGSAGGELDGQLEALRAELDAKDTILRELQEKPHATLNTPDAAKLRSENDLLKKLLEEKNRFIADLAKQPPAAAKTEGDLERYETELNEIRHQLEGDRDMLNKEVETLRERNKELDDAVREMEMEMSKERAELARERMRLERVREEVKSDMEKMQREAAVRDAMAPLQKLRDEMTGKQPPAKGDKPLNDRLRGMRNQLTDSGSAAS